MHTGTLLAFVGMIFLSVCLLDCKQQKKTHRGGRQNSPAVRNQNSRMSLGQKMLLNHLGKGHLGRKGKGKAAAKRPMKHNQGANRKKGKKKIQKAKKQKKQQKKSKQTKHQNKQIQKNQRKKQNHINQQKKLNQRKQLQKRKQKNQQKKQKHKNQKNQINRLKNQLLKSLSHTLVDHQSSVGVQCIYMLNKNNNHSLGNSSMLDYVCSHKFNITYINAKPYSNRMVLRIFEDILKKCCGNRISHLSTQNVPSISNENGTVLLGSADFIYPVFAYTKSRIVHGHYFVPLLDPPGTFYITEKDHFILGDLIRKCLTLWPLLAMCIFMSIIAGFVAWLLDTWSNQDEFPRPFLRGWFEGIWWSFISMTTVGYGDIAPKSIRARIFSIAWILAGIIIFSILSGELTTVLLEANAAEKHEMAGQNVGLLKNRMYDRTIIARNGGNAKTLEESKDEDLDELEELLSLIGCLKNGSVNGILLDKYTYWHMCTELQNLLEKEEISHEDKSLIEYYLNDTMKTEAPHLCQEVSYGVLIRNKEQYEFLKPVIESNRMILQAAVSTRIYKGQDHSPKQKRYISDKLFSYNIVAICMTVVGIACFGLCLEMFRKRRSISKRGSSVKNSFRRMSIKNESV